jgi:hypothetical protein
MTEKTYNGFEGISVDGIDSLRLPIHREAGADKGVIICRRHTIPETGSIPALPGTYPVAKPPTALLRSKFIGPFGVYKF